MANVYCGATVSKFPWYAWEWRECKAIVSVGGGVGRRYFEFAGE